jgi:starvation-inducible DNA-binding protein
MPARETIPVAIGLEREDRKRLAEVLEGALADTYVLYAKVQGVHWNVSGPSFYAIHTMIEEQYEDLADSIDELAERIRAIGYLAPSRLQRLLERSRIEEASRDLKASDMTEVLAKDHQAVAKSLRDAVKEATAIEDVFTADMLTARIGHHEKFAWMLRAAAAPGA